MLKKSVKYLFSFFFFFFKVFYFSINLKVIYIVRNPKDVTVSYFHFIKMSTQAQFDGNFKDFFKAFVSGDGKFFSTIYSHDFYLSLFSALWSLVEPC
jgi:hypothetical protein